jgi:hypothetical protein
VIHLRGPVNERRLLVVTEKTNILSAIDIARQKLSKITLRALDIRQ